MVLGGGIRNLNSHFQRFSTTDSRIAPFFALDCIFFPANEEATLKSKQPIRFQGLFKVTDQIAEKNLQLLFPKD